MHIKRFTIKNFKSFKELTIELNPDLNIFTGVNNAGKTTVLEAISLWHECFSKLLTQARKGGENYSKGDWILGPKNNKYFPFDQINSVRSPNFEDIFFQRDKKNRISLSALIADKANTNITIEFAIGQSGMNYIIELINYDKLDFTKFNSFFSFLPDSIGIVYASPVSAIKQNEDFATDPQVKDAVLQRDSASVLRNRIYRLHRHVNQVLFTDFLNELSFILYNNKNKISLSVSSDISKDTKIIVCFKVGNDRVEKDIALLGSGSLQAIEILLDIYQPGEGEKDFSLVLLDEPDSHIHRDIQQRLITVLNKFTVQKRQIFLTTHNESLIRSAPQNSLFHLDSASKNLIRSLGNNELEKTGHNFSGLMPSFINPVIKSVGDANGLDFINAIEADRLIFVEGEDDARAIHELLKHRTGIQKRNMFWSLGGINKVFTDILSFHKVFSAIKNGKSLWDKAVLIIDKDNLSDDFKTKFAEKLESKIGLKTFIGNAYTFESSIFTDLVKLSNILAKWISKKSNIDLNTIDQDQLFKAIESAYSNYKTDLSEKLNEPYYKEVCNQYKYVYQPKCKEITGHEIINVKDVELFFYIKNYLESIINSGEFYKIMNKIDVQNVLNKVLEAYKLTYISENDFIDLLKQVDKSNWLDEWDYLLNL